ncbi:MAG: riboflavin kinase [Lachnospiraceae bacterium]|nr:riboflavin kinase [Lachnospiraceae bacterium]
MILKGEVIHGKEKGRKIGFPTVNLLPEAGFSLPETGVYASKVVLMEKPRPFIGITNVGLRPTADDENGITIETHILDYEGDLYGQKIELEICDFLRPIQKFESMEALGEQLKKDKENARKLFLKRAEV